MSFDPALVNHLAKLARLRIDGPESERLGEELGRVVAYLDLLAEIDPGEFEPSAPHLAASARLRDDRVRDALPPEDALAGAPDRVGGEFVVPGVLPVDGARRSVAEDEGRA